MSLILVDHKVQVMRKVQWDKQSGRLSEVPFNEQDEDELDEFTDDREFG